ncbi:MAG TPA: hypothetical protein VH188_01185 [Chthoniobacterales bacterium]|jgi:hypothetical protein|nr:hypothetical protein [Chthoniobacterales bacterium]
MTASSDRYPKYLDWLRYLSAFLLLLYGSSKLLGRQFSVAPELGLRPVGSLSGYQLAWYYYSYSHVYSTLLGLIQLAGAALLLFRKSALLGAALLLPVITNIFLINIFFFIAWGAVCTSALIFASMLALLWHERWALVGVFWTNQVGESAARRKCHRMIAVAVVLSVIVLMAVASWFDAAHRPLAK